jgi:hypothetical protein
MDSHYALKRTFDPHNEVFYYRFCWSKEIYGQTFKSTAKNREIQAESTAKVF